MVASLSCCNFAAAQVPRGGQFRRRTLLRSAFVLVLVSHSLEALALELGEPDAVGGVRDVEVEDRPDEREATGLAGEAADHLRAAFDLAERSLEQVRAPPSSAVAGGVAQVHDERVDVVAETSRRGGVPGAIELADQGHEPLPSVALVDGLVERLPVGLADALALAFGDLGQ
jgi:hypothetical protein